MFITLNLTHSMTAQNFYLVFYIRRILFCPFETQWKLKSVESLSVSLKIQKVEIKHKFKVKRCFFLYFEISYKLKIIR